VLPVGRREDEGEELAGDFVDDDEAWVFAVGFAGGESGGRDADRGDENGGEGGGDREGEAGRGKGVGCCVPGPGLR
jgi:hypothetical protein